MNNYNEQLNQLMRVYSSAKRKMILGIVFSSAALFCFIIFISFVYDYYSQDIAWVFLFFAFCCLGVGLPFLIIGINRKRRANIDIYRLKKDYEMNNKSDLTVDLSYAPQCSPNYATQNVKSYHNQYDINGQSAEMNVKATSENAFVQEISSADEIRKYKELLDMGVISQEEFDTKKKQLLENNNVNVGMHSQQQKIAQPLQSQVTSQPQPQVAPQPQETFVDIDWRKYEPLDAGVSYNKDKDYKFAHMDGYCGSVPQKFIDRTFPRCPICCSNDPYWTLGQQMQMSWKGSLYLFKCSHCEGVISMSMPDVTTLRDGASGIISNPNVGLVNLAAKASSGKKAGVVYAVIESVGNSGVTRECEGKEFKLEDLQDMFLRK